VLDLVAGQPDQLGWWWLAGAFEKGGHHQEGVGQHGKRDPAVPGAPAADLMLVQTRKALAGLEGLLDPPAPSGDLDQDGQRHRRDNRSAPLAAGRVPNWNVTIPDGRAQPSNVTIR